MVDSVLERVRARLTPVLVQHVSAFLDERPSSVYAAMEDVVPALVRGLIERTPSEASAETLLTVINRVGQGIDLGELSRAAVSVDDLVRAGDSVLGTIFGGLSRAVVDRVAVRSELRPESAAAVTALLAPIVLAVLGRAVSSRGLGALGLVGLLDDQRDEVRRVLPAGLSSVFAPIAQTQSM